MCDSVRKNKSINLWVAFYTLSCKARKSASSVTGCVGHIKAQGSKLLWVLLQSTPGLWGLSMCDNAALTGDKLQSRTHSSVEPFHLSRAWDATAVVLEKTGQEEGHYGCYMVTTSNAKIPRHPLVHPMEG